MNVPGNPGKRKEHSAQFASVVTGMFGTNEALTLGDDDGAIEVGSEEAVLGSNSEAPPCITIGVAAIS